MGELFTLNIDLSLFNGLSSKDEGRFNPLFTRTLQTRKRIVTQNGLTVRTRDQSNRLNKDLRDPVEKVSEEHRLIFTENSRGLLFVSLNISIAEQIPKTSSTLVLNLLLIVDQIEKRIGHRFLCNDIESMLLELSIQWMI